MFEADAGGAPNTGSAANLSDSGEPVQLAQAPAEPIGSVEELAGTVTLTRADGSTATAAPGDPVYLDDTVATSPDGSVEIVFVDGTRFSLGQDGQMTLDQLVYNPGGSDNELDLSVVQGAFTFVTGTIAGAPGDGMEVHVPVGTIGIRGTAVGGGPDLSTADPTDYTIVLLPEQGGRVGRIVLTDRNGRSVILDQALEAMDISSLGLAPGEPVQLTREQVLELLGVAVENIEDILEEIQNFESPEEQQNPEAGPQQRGDALPPTPNSGGINTPKGDTQSLTELTTLFSLSDQQGFGDGANGGPLGGFTPGGGLGNSGGNGGPQGGPSDSDSPLGSDDPLTGETPPPGSGLFLLTGGEGDDVLDASGIGAANIVGLGGNDTLIGSSQDDILIGGDGNDTLDAGAGNDQVNGGGGNDLIIGGSGQGNDALDGGAGIDTVQYSSATQSITVNLDAGFASGDPAIGNDTLSNIENVIGGQGDDFITGNGEANGLAGGDGDDELTGLGGDDTIIGGDGDDMAVFTGNFNDYEITGAEGGFFVTDLREGANDGTDFVAFGVEALRFADQEVVVAPDAVNDFHVVGESQQEVTNGAAMKTTVNVAAGAVLTLQYNFLDSEPTSDEATFKDFAVVVINGQAMKLQYADVDGAETPIGTGSVQFDEQTGYLTFTFTFTEAGTYDLGLAVMNEGDQLYDAGLLVDDISMTGGVINGGFEDGLSGWTTVGSVTTSGPVEGIPAPEGNSQVVLISNGESASGIEQFLGVAPGTLSTVGNQPVVSGNVLDNDDAGGADIAVASVAFAGDPEDVENVNGTTANGITTFMAVDGSWKLEFELATGEYVFTVLKTLEHSGDNVLTFPFSYTIEGITGIASSATLTILVNDGVPDAQDDTGNVATEGGGEIGGNVLFNDGFSPDGAWVTAIKFGNGQPILVPVASPLSVTTPLGGTLVIAASGAWTYTPPAALPDTDPGTEVFTYIVTDGDGDTDSATVELTVEPANVDEFLWGTPYADQIHGRGGNDIIEGMAGDDALYGDAGDDHLVGAEGNDSLQGGAGNDILAGGLGDDTIDGGDGTDTVRYADEWYSVEVDLLTGHGYDGSGGVDTLTSIENVIGSEYNDEIFGDYENNVLIGGGGADWIDGRGGDDAIVVLVEAGYGYGYDYDKLADNTVIGGDGNDTLILSGDSADLDLLYGPSLSGIERIDVTGSGGYTVTLSADDVIRISDTDEMTILGDTGDEVIFNDTGWTQQAGGAVNVGGTLFNVYTNNSATLYVDTDMDQPVVG